MLTIANQVRFLDTGSNVITDKEQKRVWFSRLWLSIRRKQSKRKPPADPGGLAPPVTPAALADIQCEFNDFYTTTITVYKVKIAVYLDKYFAFNENLSEQLKADVTKARRSIYWSCNCSHFL